MTPAAVIIIPLEGDIQVLGYCRPKELVRLLDDIRNRPLARDLVLSAIEGETQPA